MTVEQGAGPGDGGLTVVLVDDHAVVRLGLRNLIEDEVDIRVVGEAGSCAEAGPLVVGLVPDVVLLDLRLPDGLGIGLLPMIRASAPRTRVLVLTSYADDGLLLASLKAGVDGYLMKDVAAGDLVAEIRRVARQGSVVGPVTKPMVEAGLRGAVRDTELTGQEARVFEEVARGRSNREVAASLGLSEKTVRNYLSRVFEKLGVRRRSELVALYLSGRPWLGRGGR